MSNHDFATEERRLLTKRLNRIKYRYVAWECFCSWCQKTTRAASTGTMTVCSECGR